MSADPLGLAVDMEELVGAIALPRPIIKPDNIENRSFAMFRSLLFMFNPTWLEC